MLATPRAPRVGSSGRMAKHVWMTAKVRSYCLPLWFRWLLRSPDLDSWCAREGWGQQGVPSRPICCPTLICLSFLLLSRVCVRSREAGRTRAKLCCSTHQAQLGESLHRGHWITTLALEISLAASLPDTAGSCCVLTGQAPPSRGTFRTMTLLTHPQPTQSVVLLFAC